MNNLRTSFVRLDHDMDLALFVRKLHYHHTLQLGSRPHSPTSHCQARSRPIFKHHVFDHAEEQMLTAQNELVIASIGRWESVPRVHSIPVVSRLSRAT